MPDTSSLATSIALPASESSHRVLPNRGLDQSTRRGRHYDTVVIQTFGLSKVDRRRIENSLNWRPRMTLGYRTPAEKYAEVVALST